MVKNNNSRLSVLKTVLLTLAASFIYAVYAGIRNNYGIMLSAVTDSTGVSFASVSFVLAAGQLVFGLAQPAFGMLASERGSIYAFVSGAVLASAGMLLIPMCRSAVSLLICLGIILPAGTGAVSFGLLMGTAEPKLPSGSVSVISGIVSAGSGIGNIILSPVLSILIRAGGLMYGMAVLTVPVMLTLPVSLLLTRSVPKTAAAENSLLHQPETEQKSIKLLFKKAVKNRIYISLMSGFFTCGFHMALLTNHLPAQIQSFGFSAETAAYAFSAYGAAGAAGSVLSGSLCGRYKMKNVLGFFYGLRPITVLLFILLPKTLFNITLFTVLFGFSGAATVPPVSGIISRTFGAGNLAALYGFVFFIHQTGGFFGAWLGGLCFEASGSYLGIWAVSIVFSTAASVISFAVNETADGL